MIASAAWMCGLGLITTFGPAELLTSTGATLQTLPTLLVQAVGGLYLGFAILNWMAKDNLIGGIYSKPVALGNFLHFLVVSMALVRAVAPGHRDIKIGVLALGYAVFAAWFGLVTFTHPQSDHTPAGSSSITNE